LCSDPLSVTDRQTNRIAIRVDRVITSTLHRDTGFNFYAQAKLSQILNLHIAVQPDLC